MIKPNQDTIDLITQRNNMNTDTFVTHSTTIYMGSEIKIISNKQEVQGLVDGRQVYGIYIDRGIDSLRSSTAQCPCGSFNDSVTVIHCMQLVINHVKAMFNLTSV